MAGGAPGHGEAAPGDHLQTGYRLWLAGRPARARPRAVARPVLVPPGGPGRSPTRPGGRSACRTGRSSRIFGPVLAWNVFTLLCLFGAGGCWRCSGCASSALSRLAAAVGGLAFEIAPYRLAQSRGHLLGPISLLLPLALWAFERARQTGRPALVVALAPGARRRSRSPARCTSRSAAIPFYVALRRLPDARVPAALRGGDRRASPRCSRGVLIRYAVIEGSIDEGGRSLAEVQVYSATGLDLVTRHARHGAEAFVFLGWLTPLARDRRLRAARSGRPRPARDRARPRRARPRLARARHAQPALPRALARLPAAPLPARAGADDAGRLPRARGARRGRGRLGGPAAGGAARARGSRWRRSSPSLLLADLHVRAFHPTAADASNKAYAAVRKAPKGRLVELPVFLPDIHYGSVYLYYEQRAQRERPLGYSTTAPVRADVVAPPPPAAVLRRLDDRAPARRLRDPEGLGDHAPPRALHRRTRSSRTRLAGVAGARRPRLAAARRPTAR